MGADGGVVYVNVREPCEANYDSALALLRPFWQLLDVKGSDHGVDSREEWLSENVRVRAPRYLVGSYGTDMGDYVCLDDLKYICEARGWEDCAELYELTFEELDLDYHTTPMPVSGGMHYQHGAHPLHHLWYQHFMYTPREEVLSRLGVLSGMRASEWVQRLNEALEWGSLTTVETWT